MTKVLSTVGKVAKMLPVVSLVNYVMGKNGMREDVMEGLRKNPDRMVVKPFLKYFGHFAYSVIGFTALTLEYIGFSATGEINPLKARHVIAQRIEHAEAEKINYQKLVYRLSELADINKNGKLELDERVEAFKRMGLENQVKVQVQFPQLKLEDLEKAVQSYQHR